MSERAGEIWDCPPKVSPFCVFWDLSVLFTLPRMMKRCQHESHFRSLEIGSRSEWLDGRSWCLTGERYLKHCLLGISPSLLGDLDVFWFLDLKRSM